MIHSTRAIGLLIMLSMACSATAQQANTIRLRIVDPANSTSPTTRTHQIRDRNVVRFADRTPPVRAPRADENTSSRQLIREARKSASSTSTSHRNRYVTQVPVEPGNSRVRLAQAEEGGGGLLDELESSTPDSDTDFDDLLNRARDLIDKEADPTEPDAGDMTPDDTRDKMRDDLDRLLSDDEDEGGSGLDLDDDDEDEEEETYTYQDPTPDPIRRARSDQPYTLSGVFDDDVYDPQCVQQYCNAVWNCAGGRCQSWWDRVKRRHERDMMVKSSQCCGLPPSPLANFKCPKVRKPSNFGNQQQQQQPMPQTGGSWEPVYGNAPGGGEPMPGGDMNYDPLPPNMAPSLDSQLDMGPEPAELPGSLDDAISGIDS